MHISCCKNLAVYLITYTFLSFVLWKRFENEYCMFVVCIFSTLLWKFVARWVHCQRLKNVTRNFFVIAHFLRPLAFVGTFEWNCSSSLWELHQWFVEIHAGSGSWIRSRVMQESKDFLWETRSGRWLWHASFVRYFRSVDVSLLCWDQMEGCVWGVPGRLWKCKWRDSMKDGAEWCGWEVKEWRLLGKGNYAKWGLVCCVVSGSLSFLIRCGTNYTRTLCCKRGTVAVLHCRCQPKS